MISCRKATELISKSMDEPLGALEKLSLNIHLFVCECCDQFRKQLKLLRGALRITTADDRDTPSALSSQSKDKIKRAVDEAAQD